MSEKRRGLGRGLGALIPSNAAPVTRPLGDRPVDVFFPGSESEPQPGAVERRSGGEGGEGPGSAAALTVLPGGRLAPGGASWSPPAQGEAPPGSQGGTPVPPVARVTPTSDERPPAPAVPQALTRPMAPVPPVAPVAPVAPAVPVTSAGSLAALAGTPAVPGQAAPAARAGSSEGATAEGGPSTAVDVVPMAVSAAVPDAVPAELPSDGLVPVPGATFAELPVDAVRPNPRQPRQVFDEEELTELVHSIREVGVLQPVVVRRVADEDGEPRFELIMGERRLRATREAGLDRIPAIVRDTQDDALLRDALLENLHRSQLNPLEEAAAYQQLLDDFGCTHEELASRIGRSRPQISNTLRLLKLPALVQRRVAAGVLSAGHARALLGLEDQAAMERLAQRIVAEGLSVRAVEEIVALGDGPVARTPKRRPRPGAHTSELNDLASRLGDRLDTRVTVALGRNKGRLSIDFASVEDLNRIMGLLGPDVRGAFRGDGQDASR